MSAALTYHSQPRPGKLAIVSTKPCTTRDDLSLAYTPGVAEPCLEIERDPELAYRYTMKGNLVAVITNGTAVLGLGDIGPLAAKPVMEGKAVLFKQFADVDAIDIELHGKSTEEMVRVIEAISPSFGGINLEDIRAPECFEVESMLKERLSIPVFHDDQHGTAIVIAAALMNALRLNGKRLNELAITVNGAGAAAIATIHFLRQLGVPRSMITVLDRRGVIYENRPGDSHKRDLSVDTAARTLADALAGADVFIGVSVADALKPELLCSMSDSPIIFALANPVPEISYEEALRIRPDALVATGRSDTPNQVNNVLAFPYVFRAALDSRARQINFEMMRAAAEAIAEIARTDLAVPFGPAHLVPSPFNPTLAYEVSYRIAEAAVKSRVASPTFDLARYPANLMARFIGRPPSP